MLRGNGGRPRRDLAYQQRTSGLWYRMHRTKLNAIGRFAVTILGTT